MFRAAALVAVVSLCGCSIALQEKPSRSTPVVADNCSTSRTWPIVDSVGVAAGVATMTYGFTDQEHKAWPMTAALVAAIPTMIYLASAVNGYRDAATCRDLKGETAPVAVR